jgi:hypothetical protein
MGRRKKKQSLRLKLIQPKLEELIKFKDIIKLQIGLIDLIKDLIEAN